MYKIIQNNKVIDIVKYPQFIKFLPTGHIACTDKTTAQGLVKDDILYSFTNIPNVKTEIITIKEISAEEFSKLQNLLNSGKEVCADNSLLSEAQKNKIARLSSICRSKIISGFSIKLSDNKLYNFKLTLEDQINLTLIENQLNTDMETFIYHATDKPCQFFTRADMFKIISCFKQHTQYHTTYFNAAKHYIKSLTDIDKINRFVYGDSITHTVDNAILKQILINGEVSSDES